VFTDGISALPDSEQNYHTFSPNVPPELGIGVDISLSIMRAARQGRMIPFAVKGKRTIHGRDSLLLEADSFRGSTHLGMEIPTAYEKTGMEVVGLRCYVDPQTYTIIQINENFIPRRNIQGRTKDSILTITFPDGYFSTPNGYAPRKMAIHGIEMVDGIRQVSTFQLLGGQYWLLKEAKTYLHDRLLMHTFTTNPSLGPIDPSLFDLKAAGMEIKDPTQGEGSISGKLIHYDTMRPIEGARVSLQSDPYKSSRTKWGEMQTGYDGSFQFSELPELTYCLVAEKEGLVSYNSTSNKHYKIDENTQAYEILYLKKENREETVELYLAKPRTISGKVVRIDTEEPIAEATVHCGGKETKTGVDGTFQLEGLAARQSVCWAEAEGYIPRLFFHRTKSKPYQQSVDLAENQTIDNVLLKLTPGGAIEGQVRDPDGSPVANADVGLPAALGTQSDEHGHYRLDGLPTASISGQEGVELLAIADGYLGTEVGPIHIQSINTPIQQDIVLNTGGYIAGRVSDATGEPIAGLMVHLENKDIRGEEANLKLMMMGMSPLALKPITDVEGKYKSDKLLPGNYKMSAATDGYQPFTGASLKVENGKTSQLDIELQPASSVAGIVIGPTKAPIINAWVYLGKHHMQPDMDGRFAFKQIEDGSFTLTVRRLATKYTVEQEKSIENVYPGQTDLVIQFPEPPAKPKLKGRVVDTRTGKPVSTYKIWLRTPTLADLLSSHAIDNASGTFLFPSVRPGKTMAIITAPGYAARVQGPYHLRPNEVKEIAVFLEPESIIQGRVYTNDKQRQFDLTPRLTAYEPASLDPTPYSNYYNQYYGVRVDANRDGSFTIRHVPAMQFDLRISDKTRKWASITPLSVTEPTKIDLGNILIEEKESRYHAQPVDVTIKQSDGNPCKNTSLFHFPPDKAEPAPLGQTDKQGNGHFNLRRHYLESPWVLGIGKNPYYLYQCPARAGHHVIILDATAGNHTLKGLITHKGMPQKDRLVTVFPADERSPYPIFQTKTNAFGRFAVNGIAAGTYNIFAEYAYKETNHPFGFTQIHLNNRDEFIQMELKGQSVSGVVMGPYGNPLAGAYVQIGLVFHENAYLKAAFNHGPRRSTQADEFGRFQFDDVQAGAYELFASHISYGVSAKERIDVKGKDLEKVRLKVDLPKNQ
ncbi:hypothetical protein GF373_14870, partial [bacterium]|nr:hypothetical protein [bacterium]